MSAPSVNVITNSLGSCDWVVVKLNGEQVHAGHYISPRDLFEIMQNCVGYEDVFFVEVTDQQIEEGDY